MPLPAQSVFPTLRYRDPRAAVAWLCSAMAFATHFVAEEDGMVVHAQLRLGDQLIFLGPDHAEDRYGMHSPLALNGTNQCVYIAVDDDVHGHCDRARSAGAEIVSEPWNTPYGSREVSFRDPEGHVWTIGTYRGEPL